jgi:DNA polymerase-3 subunit alpha (Gram-positive type)
VNPEQEFDYFNIKLTGITPEMAEEAPTFPEVWEKIGSIMESGILIAHNAPFDMSFMKAAAGRCGVDFPYASIDTVPLSRALLPDLKKVKLNLVAEHLKLGKFRHHRANDDAEMLAKVFLALIEKAKEKVEDCTTVGALNNAAAGTDLWKGNTYHVIILSKIRLGLKTFTSWCPLPILTISTSVPVFQSRC